MKGVEQLASTWRHLSPEEKVKLWSNSSAEIRELIVTVWEFMARESQVPPPEFHTDKPYWIILSGRGFGKTRVGAEETLNHIEKLGAKARIALVGSTASDVRDTMVEGESGIIACARRRGIEVSYEPSKRRLTFGNGGIATAFSAEKPDRLRGPQHTFAWCDELSSWEYDDETWDMMIFGLRLGECPQCIVTTTPKPRPLIKALLEHPSAIVTRGSTYDNAANLSPQFLAEIKRRYEGTRLGQQELYGDLLADNPGALWQTGLIEPYRIDDEGMSPLELIEELDIGRIVIAIDPAVTSGEKSDMTGLMVVGKANEGDGFFVLEDATCKDTPEGWIQKACVLYHKWSADRVIAEVNQGGDMVESLLRIHDPNVPYRGVRAVKGKRTRAEPIAALYEQGRVSHVGLFKELEEQMCEYAPDGFRGSPDRVDALVWGLHDLAITRRGGRVWI